MNSENPENPEIPEQPEIPDSWPPPDISIPKMVVPLFPLKDMWLFPGSYAPLHIFEPRYREMIEDSLDGPGRLVLGTVMAGHEKEMAGAPPVYPIAGLGEIGRHDRMPDGRFAIILVGMARVVLRELESDRSYRQVEVERLQEVQPEGEPDGLRDSLREAIEGRTGKELPKRGKVSLGSLADLLALQLELPHEIVQSLYSERDVGLRAQKALSLHEERA